MSPFNIWGLQLPAGRDGALQHRYHTGDKYVLGSLPTSLQCNRNLKRFYRRQIEWKSQCIVKWRVATMTEPTMATGFISWIATGVRSCEERTGVLTSLLLSWCVVKHWHTSKPCRAAEDAPLGNFSIRRKEGSSAVVCCGGRSSFPPL